MYKSQKVINLILKDISNKIISYIPLEREYFNKIKDSMIKKDEIMFKTEKLIVIIDFPLENPVKFKIYRKNSYYTRLDLVKIVIDLYEKIYSDKTDKYKIYGHYIEDLVLYDMKFNYMTKELTLNIKN